MRRFIILLVTAAAVVAPASASAQLAPASDPILTKLDRTPMVELWDGGGGLPYLGSSTSYNAGDWENTLRAYHGTPGHSVYNDQLAKVDAVAAQWLRRAGKLKNKFHFKAKQFGHSARRAMSAIKHHGKHHGKKTAIVFDVDETLLSNYTAIDADNFTFGPQSQAEATNEIGTAIEPSRDLFDLAKQKRHHGLPDHRAAREHPRAHDVQPDA